MADLAIASSTRTTLLQLQRTRSLLDVAALRLATGQKVSTPFDDASAFFLARALTARAADLLRVKDEINQAATIVGGAVDTLESMVTLLENIKSTIIAAKGGDVSGAVSTTVTGDTVTTASAAIATAIAGAENLDSFDITHDGTTTTLAITGTTTFTELAATISAISGLTATVSDGNTFVITAADGQDITIANNVNDLATDLGLSSSTNGTQATNDARQAAEVQFDLVRTQLDALASEATILSTNLLSTSPDTLSVNLSDVSTSTLSIAGVATNVTALSITAVDTADSFATDEGITAAVAELDAAISELEATVTTFSSQADILETRIDFNNQLVDTLQAGAALLTAADLNEETANLLALQTRHDLGVTALGYSFTNGTALTELLRLG